MTLTVGNQGFSPASIQLLLLPRVVFSSDQLAKNSMLGVLLVKGASIVLTATVELGG